MDPHDPDHGGRVRFAGGVDHGGGAASADHHHGGVQLSLDLVRDYSAVFGVFSRVQQVGQERAMTVWDVLLRDVFMIPGRMLEDVLPGIIDLSAPISCQIAV